MQAGLTRWVTRVCTPVTSQGVNAVGSQTILREVTKSGWGPIHVTSNEDDFSKQTFCMKHRSSLTHSSIYVTESYRVWIMGLLCSAPVIWTNDSADDFQVLAHSCECVNTFILLIQSNRPEQVCITEEACSVLANNSSLLMLWHGKDQWQCPRESRES